MTPIAFSTGRRGYPSLCRRSGYEIVAEIGVPAIRAKSIRQKQRLIELADAAGVLSSVRETGDPWRHRDARRLKDTRTCKYVGGTGRGRGPPAGAGIRVSPHF